jgi:hypothetical protein
MAGIWPYCIPIAAVVALGVVLLRRRRPPRINQASGHCSSCRTPMSLRRVPLAKSHALLGEWVCPHCGNKSKAGKGVPGTA